MIINFTCGPLRTPVRIPALHTAAAITGFEGGRSGLQWYNRGSSFVKPPSRSSMTSRSQGWSNQCVLKACLHLVPSIQYGHREKWSFSIPSVIYVERWFDALSRGQRHVTHHHSRYYSHVSSTMDRLGALLHDQVMTHPHSQMMIVVKNKFRGKRFL